jgi:hypothetical protein
MGMEQQGNHKSLRLSSAAVGDEPVDTSSSSSAKVDNVDDMSSAGVDRIEACFTSLVGVEMVDT